MIEDVRVRCTVLAGLSTLSLVASTACGGDSEADVTVGSSSGTQSAGPQGSPGSSQPAPLSPASTSPASMSPPNLSVGRIVVETIYAQVCGATTTNDAGCAPVLLDGVIVTVRTPDGGSISTGTTDVEGTVAFDLDTGTYTIEVAPDARAHITPPARSVVVTKGVTITEQFVYASAFQ